MYSTGDTITAVSSVSPPGGRISETIIRVSGPRSAAVVRAVSGHESVPSDRGVWAGRIHVTEALGAEACVYFFHGPHSYTGEDLVEIHLLAAAPVVEVFVTRLLEQSRPAGPGEFTLRAYLSGRMDLSQAEAVAQIISGSNGLQIAAAEDLLRGRLSRTIEDCRERIMDLLSRVEGGMDFAMEDIRFITPEEAIEQVDDIRRQLQRLLEGGIRYEALIDLPSVGLAGLPNAGKSTLLNALLGRQRSLVSSRAATTRDILTATLDLPGGPCALFDCAGLLANIDSENAVDAVLNRLAHESAVQALRSASVVAFCVDVGNGDWPQEKRALALIENANVFFVATKADLLAPADRTRKVGALAQQFGGECLMVSAARQEGLDELRTRIDLHLRALRAHSAESDERIALNQRHRRIVQEALVHLQEAGDALGQAQDEVAAMLLRLAYQGLGLFEAEDIDEAVLERVFANFCIGK